MPDWIVNPYGIPYAAWVIFAIGLLVCTVIGIIAGLSTLWTRREKRDGLR